ncbi:hypothetical protein AVEN_227962-1 [Araneus ventricosus]|uniref:Uncharacterized protein n=1 Tax=Araneus ventricosus TaxID=182803 RepID=A0A4Y2F9B3_ARAVE|nr:hypothetical protein AVEN_224424-1 [Araneus ventricosus]GBM37587.1 hypothetical protein AVEN_227962-1 [Araneus ventricosus]
MFSHRRSWRQRVGDPKRNEVSGYRTLHMNSSFSSNDNVLCRVILVLTIKSEFQGTSGQCEVLNANEQVNAHQDSGATNICARSNL